MSYGSAATIASLVPRYANGSGAFDTVTKPTLAQVGIFINEVSGVLDISLATAGLTIPVTQTTCVLALDMFVNQEVAAIVEGINGSGRFGPNQKSGGTPSRYNLILKDVDAFVKQNAIGFERLGAARSYAVTAGMAYRDTDVSGNDTFPLFQRKGFGSNRSNTGGETFVDKDTD
jgi:hypothetical protein